MKFKKVITFIMTTLLIVLNVCSYAAEPSYAEDLKTIRDNNEITGQVVPLSDPIVGDAKNKDDFSKFTDIKNGAWYYNAAKWCYENDVMSGTSNTTFAPGLTVTRAMIVTCLAKIDGVEKSDYPTCHFSDCKDDSWYSPYVEWAYGKGITAGTSATHFSPNSTLTREQLATILYAYAGYAGYDAAYDEQTLDIYNDSSSISRWAVSGMAWSVGNGIISGTSSTTLSPKKGCSRAEMAQMLYKFFENKDKPEQEPEPVSSAALEELINSGCILQKTPLPNDFISRADFAVDIIHFTAFDAYIDKYAFRGEFDDMTANDRAAAAAEIAVGQGYLTVTDGLFEPDKPIAYADAVRALLYAVGYREYSEKAGYFTLAREIELLNGMSDRAENSAHITYAEFGVLAKNAINLETVQCVNLDGEYTIVKRGPHNSLKNNYLTSMNGTNERLLRIANIGWDIYPGGGCRFGASMIINDDGTIDAWLAGLSDDGSSESDWGYYRRTYDGGISWTADITALRPTYGTSDWRWTCDPGVVKIGDYYYCGYTSISWADGLDNNMFIARSKDPTDFFDEKWDGSGWSGKAEPAVVFDGEYSKWGTGEPCFVVKDGVIYCYVTWKADYNSARVYTAPADDPNWPGKLTFAGTAFKCDYEEDSCDVKYVDAYDCYMSFSTAQRFTDNSYIRVRTSYDGVTFRPEHILRSDNAVLLRKIHNMGITGTADGHLDITKQNYISYAYAAEESGWGNWRTRFAPITWLGTPTYGSESTVIRSVLGYVTDTENSLEAARLIPTNLIGVTTTRKTYNYKVRIRFPDGTERAATADELAGIEYQYDESALTVDPAKLVITVKDFDRVTVIKLKYKGIYSTISVYPERYGNAVPTLFYPETDTVVLDRLNMKKQPGFIATDGNGNYLHLWGKATSFNKATQWLFNNSNVGNWQQYVTFTDYDRAIISVDPNTGIIKPRAAGTTILTAEYCGMTASITVTVDESCFY